MRLRAIAIAIIVVIAILLVAYAARRRPDPNLPCGGCPPGLSVCDSVTGQCVACTAGDATHCPSGQPFCTNANQCAVCLGDTTGCPPGTFCDRGTRCVACRGSIDCPPGRVCLPDGSGCVECLADRDCGGDPAKPYCGPGNSCVACRAAPTDTCGKDSPTAPHCLSPPGVCVRCRGDGDCPGGGFCVARAPGAPPSCVQCVEGDPKRACPGGQFCVAGGTCAQCVEGDPARACPPGQACLGGQCVRGCLTNSDCGPASSTPNCIGGVCVACASDQQCASAFPGLLPFCANGLCVECQVDQNGKQKGCSNPATPVCVGSVCEQCGRDSDCKDNPRGPFCEKVVTSHGTGYACVACTSDEYCAQHNPATPWCDPASYSCVACGPGHSCPADQPVCGKKGRCVSCDAGHGCPGGMWCSDPDGGQCIQCRGDLDCAGRKGAPFCDTASGMCVACRGKSDCPPGAPVCLPDESSCVQCTANSDCRTPPNGRCSASPDALYTCVECDTPADCSNPNARYCAGHRCLECQGDSDCGGGACVSGKCVSCLPSALRPPAGTLVFLQNRAAGTGFWLSLRTASGPCNQAVMASPHSGGQPGYPATPTYGWLASQTFAIESTGRADGSFFLANSAYALAGLIKKWYFVRQGSPSKPLLGLQTDFPGHRYDPTKDPGAAWVLAGGVLTDPGRTVMLAVDPAVLDPCVGQTAGFPPSPLIQIVPFARAGCTRPGSVWDFVRAPSRSGFGGPVRSVLEDRLSGPDSAIDKAFGDEDSIYDEFRGWRWRDRGPQSRPRSSPRAGLRYR